MSRRLALLMDGDNAQAVYVGVLLAALRPYGEVIIRRVYGDWTSNAMNGWKETLNLYALQPVQQFRYSRAKNATDAALIIDAMDLLYSGSVDGFCIASSDSDYTRLATRLREGDQFVIGAGQRQTSQAFVNACHVFIFTDTLVPAESAGVAAPGAPHKARRAFSSKVFRIGYHLCKKDADGWVTMGALASRVKQIEPAFDVRDYGYKQFTALVEAHPDLFEIRRVFNGGGQVDTFVRLRRAP